MTENDFWQLVSRTSAEQDEQSLVTALTQALTALDDQQLAEFDVYFSKQMRRAYTWPMWGAAFVLTGCDNEYAFAEFRCFLISLGKTWFERILVEPDYLAELPQFPMRDNFPYPFVDEYDLVAGKIYEDRTGEELPFVPSTGNRPAGKKFDDRKKMLLKHYPGLCQRFPF
ncbi:DUF4240 domain-containing protein [Shewanella sp. SNU WT4]|uniref:DUF4240 domain-containing protein n=1 Tax=Shewanella sp. SNU WT4 TaxID=2590015 RepID=UPI0011287BA5|nr:DUF4240 domain-containing protein [Shewanella sp. SNU WT4]QDF65947.1 DUF4240 domain-containing protein [Shewanella sp. SNU WT4]